MILETEIVEQIVDKYRERVLRERYEQYHLFELMDISIGDDIDCAWNKKEIIEALIYNNIDDEYYDIEHRVFVPKPEDIKEYAMYSLQGGNIKWRLNHIRRKENDIVIINNRRKIIMEICDGDIIGVLHADGSYTEYRIFLSLYQFRHSEDNDKYDTLYVTLTNLETDEDEEYTAQELIDMFETDNVFYVHSLLLNYLYSD